MLRLWNEPSNQGRNLRICCCKFSSSFTFDSIAVHCDCNRESCHCWMRNAPTISNATDPAVAPVHASFLEENRVVNCRQGRTLGGRNSKHGFAPVKCLAARLSSGETAASVGS